MNATLSIAVYFIKTLYRDHLGYLFLSDGGGKKEECVIYLRRETSFCRGGDSLH